MKVIFTVGLPGSGKSTFVKQLAKMKMQLFYQATLYVRSYLGIQRSKSHV